MQARLLDIGEVGPVRSQSAYHAVLSGIGADDVPVVVLARPAGTLVSVGDTQEGEVDLRESLESGLPVVRRLTGGPTEILDENDLLIQVVMPVAKAPAEAVPTAAKPAVEMLAAFGISAVQDEEGGLVTATGRLGRVHAGVLDAALYVLYSLAWSGPAGVPGGCTSSVTAQMDEPVSLADMAESFLAGLEHHFGLELIPSMPTPSELEAIYDWDGRLLIETVNDPPLRPTTTASLH